MNALADVSTNWMLIFSVVFALTAAAVWVYARAIPQGGASWWILSAAVVGLTLASTLAGAGTASMLLLDAAALCAVGLILTDRHPAARRAGRLYLTMTLAAVLCLLLAERLAGGVQPA